MTRSRLLPAALAAAAFAVTASPAFAVSISHTNRVAGDPDADRAPRPGPHAAPPAASGGSRYFDKAHESGTRG
jgi:hypothetical protein